VALFLFPPVGQAANPPNRQRLGGDMSTETVVSAPPRVRTNEAGRAVGQRVRLCGWVHRLRQIGAINFLVLRDGFGLFQGVLTPEELAPLVGCVEGSVVEVTGTVVFEAQAPGGHELHDCQVRVITAVTEPPPFEINKKEVKATLNTFLDHGVVGLRHPNKWALFRLSAGIMAGFRATLSGLGFTEVQTPKLVASATESGANVFKVDYFGRPAYLAQSPQFYKQTMVGIFERVFEVGPVFRAEPHDTTRHINEYVSLDVEFGFIENHFDVMEVLNRVLEGMVAAIRAQAGEAVALLGAPRQRHGGLALPEVPREIPSIHFADALDLYSRETGEDARGEPDLAPQHERWLGEWARQEHGSDFLFVTGYPMVKRPFYTHPDPARPAYSNSFDLLFRGTELITGGQRLHGYDDYLAALARAGYAPEPFATYLEAFRYGMPPHGGFAIGLERLLMQLLGMNNLRLVTLFPRDQMRTSP